MSTKNKTCWCSGSKVSFKPLHGWGGRERGYGIFRSLLPEDQKASFLVGMYVMLSKAYVPNFRRSESKTKKLGSHTTRIERGTFRRKRGRIAQSVERWSNKPLVMGSIPIVPIFELRSFKKKKVSESKFRSWDL